MKKILVIGAGFLQDFVIQKAKSMGYYTLAVDADPTAVGFKHADRYAVINIVDKEPCLQYAIENKIDGVLTAATDFGVLTASYIAQKMGLIGLNYKSAELVKDKYKVRRCLIDNNVDDTAQVFEIAPSTNVEKLSSHIHYPVMVKPCDGSGSRGASRVDEDDELSVACHFAMESSVSHRAELESFVNGQEYGIESLVSNGDVHVLAVMKKRMTKPPYYAELGHALPNDLSNEIEQKAKTCAVKAIEALGINSGSVNMDVIITEDGQVHIVDIGARMGGNMIGPCIVPYGTGIDYMGNMIRLAVGDPLDWSVGEKAAVATRLLAFESGIIEKTPDTEALEAEYGVEIYHHMEPGQAVNEYHTNLDGCGYIIAKAEKIEDADKRVSEVLEIIKTECF